MIIEKFTMKKMVDKNFLLNFANITKTIKKWERNY